MERGLIATRAGGRQAGALCGVLPGLSDRRGTMTIGCGFTREEFGVSVRYPEFSDEELAQRPVRTAGATGTVRTLMHHYHLGFDISGLSQMMLSRLQKGGWTCPACGKTFLSGVDPRGR